MTNVIEIKDVSWKRHNETILSDINWEVAKDEHWAVIGLNGSGKTTLLNMINGYIWPTTGKVNVLHRQFGQTDIRELRKSIGWVSSSLQEKIKGTDFTENIVVSGKYASIGLYENPTGEDFQKAKEIMEQLGCGQLIGRTYQTCSQGEKQRILVARGLMGEPELLILDEPTNGLDFIAKESLLASIQQLATGKDGPTIIFVPHHTEEVLPVFTHALLLRHGKVFAKGERKEVLTSTNLSRFFDTPVQIDWGKERAWMTLSRG